MTGYRASIRLDVGMLRKGCMSVDDKKNTSSRTWKDGAEQPFAVNFYI